ncbi:hypothetical protein B0T10DRAFT_480567 [Thelonectria olida]|uniref:Uncharacterized protein n=1 Tax=Thelonectria olida TaxID=1576542 RepID=A0A9P8WE46_9HYPO|nr:hypothetical protein B0T10DRAFT_480567 [Thelonectria olida]
MTPFTACVLVRARVRAYVRTAWALEKWPGISFVTSEHPGRLHRIDTTMAHSRACAVCRILDCYSVYLCRTLKCKHASRTSFTKRAVNVVGLKYITQKYPVCLQRWQEIPATATIHLTSFR